MKITKYFGSYYKLNNLRDYVDIIENLFLIEEMECVDIITGTFNVYNYGISVKCNS